MRRVALGLMLAVALCGCQRGCLSTWLREHGLGEGLPVPPDERLGIPKEASCPDGLARCSGGTVYASRAFTPPAACSPEGCRCPWDALSVCSRGCVVEGLEIAMSRENAAAQLCKPEPGATFATPALTGAIASSPPDAEVMEPLCDVERFHCVAGTVHRCDAGKATAVASCRSGCVDGEGLIVEDIPAEAAAALLCVR